jgi:hypothetical protein
MTVEKQIFEIECNTPKPVAQAIMIAIDEYRMVSCKIEIRKKWYIIGNSILKVTLESSDMLSLSKCVILVERTLRAISGEWIPREPDKLKKPKQADLS